MAGVKLVVLYPVPRDAAAFERVYAEEHAPMVTPQNFPGMTKFVASKISSTAGGGPAPFQRIAELHFPSSQAMQAAAAGAGAQRTVEHAVKISTGGPPLFLVAEEEVTNY
jgi:uncharacterized protein (TIGR02118 family)